MASYQIMLPGKTVIGPGGVDTLGAEATALGAKHALIVTDPGVYQAGLIDPVKEQLLQAGIAFDVYSDAEPEPTLPWIDATAKELRRDSYDLVVGVGGGSSLDVAKGLSALLTYGGNAADYLGVGKVPGPVIPIIAVPTTAGTGSEATRAAVFNVVEKGCKLAFVSPYLMPRVSIVDPVLTYGCPPNITASAGIDALVHAIEAYVCNAANSFTDILAVEAIRLIGGNLRTAVKDGSNKEARGHMAEGALFAGSAYANSGLGAVHGLSQVLGARFHVPHGVANGLLLSYIMEVNISAGLPKYAVVAETLGVATQGLSPREAAEKGVETVRALTVDIGIPVRLRDVGVPEEALEELAVATMEFERPMYYNPKKLTLDDVRGIWQKAW